MFGQSRTLHSRKRGHKHTRKERQIIPAVLLAALLISTCGRTGPSGPPDLSPPLVASVTPSPTEPVPVNIAALTVTFNEKLDASTITNQTVWLLLGQALVDGSVSYQDRAIVFKPLANLNPNSIYTLIITEKVRDLAGNALAQRYIGIFVTGPGMDTTPPTVSSVTPARSSIGVDVNSSINAVFSEPVLLSSITATTFFVTNGLNSVNGTIESSGSTATFTPSGDLLYNADYTVTIRKDVTDAAGNALGSDYSWSFTTEGEPSKPTYNIDVDAGPNGRIEPGSVTLIEGASQKFTITPDGGYEISSVVVDQIPVGPVASYTFSNVTVNHTISATFVSTSHIIVATAGTGGSITPSGLVSVNQGGTQSFTITPDPDYKISNVTVDGSPVSFSLDDLVTIYTFTDVTGDHSISASFTPDMPVRHTIFVAVGENGKIEPSDPSVSVNHGGTQTFTVTPDPGYEVSSVTVDGSPVSFSPDDLVAIYTFTDVTGDHSISAAFTEETE